MQKTTKSAHEKLLRFPLLTVLTCSTSPKSGHKTHSHRRSHTNIFEPPLLFVHYCSSMKNKRRQNHRYGHGHGYGHGHKHIERDIHGSLMLNNCCIMFLRTPLAHMPTKTEAETRDDHQKEPPSNYLLYSVVCFCSCSLSSFRFARSRMVFTHGKESKSYPCACTRGPSFATSCRCPVSAEGNRLNASQYCASYLRFVSRDTRVSNTNDGVLSDVVAVEEVEEIEEGDLPCSSSAPPSFSGVIVVAAAVVVAVFVVGSFTSSHSTISARCP